MERRPLVVLSGQGIALADGFDLVGRLQGEADLVDCFDRGEPFRNDLDHVFTCCGRAGDEPLDRLIHRTREICLRARAATSDMVKQRRFLRVLAEEGKRRDVIHMTTNIDGVATTIAAGERLATWRPFHDVTKVEAVIDDLVGAFDLGRGFLHLPLHGDAGLVAQGDGAQDSADGIFACVPWQNVKPMVEVLVVAAPADPVSPVHP